MSKQRIASPYAKALIELATEKNSLDAVHNDLQLFLKVWDQNRDFRIMVNNPIIHHSKKFEVFKSLFSKHFNPLTMSFLEIIHKKHRENCIDYIARTFHTEFLASKGIKEATITSAVPLTDQQKKSILSSSEKRMGSTLQLIEEVNPELIGGFLIRVGDQQIDESVKTRLTQMKNIFGIN